MLLWALGACGEEDDGSGHDEMPVDEDASQQDEDPITATDAAARDAAATRDAARPLDAGALEDPMTETMPDGGRRHRDAGASDAGAGGAAPHDAALPPPASDAGVPTGEHCAATASWDPAWAAYEDEVLRLSNAARAAGHNCDTEGNFGPTTPLTMNANLRCAARLYSKDMADTGNFSHTGADGSTVTSRIQAAGYKSKRTWGENIALGQQTPADVVQGWLDSDGHCSNIMNPAYKEIGVGYYPKKSGSRTSPYWTQDFGG
jgi:uncharacterized protein YkwD